MKRKLEVTWAIVSSEFHDSWPTRDEAAYQAKINPPDGKWRIAKMVEADPDAAAVVRAAKALNTAFGGPSSDPEWLKHRSNVIKAVNKVALAVERLERRKR